MRSRIAACLIIMLLGAYSKENRFQQEVCVEQDRLEMKACFLTCTGDSEAGQSDEGEDSIFACESTCNRLTCARYELQCGSVTCSPMDAHVANVTNWHPCKAGK